MRLGTVRLGTIVVSGAVLAGMAALAVPGIGSSAASGGVTALMPHCSVSGSTLDPGYYVGHTGPTGPTGSTATCPSTAVKFRSFSASWTRSGVLLRWRTAMEADIVGFNVYRRAGQARIRANRKLLSAANAAFGRSYSYLDRRERRAAVALYWLQVVFHDGSPTWHGPVSAKK